MRPDPVGASALDIEAVRSQFPSLALEQDGQPVAYFDGPGGTQVAHRVIDAMADYYRTANANDGGAFATSRRSDQIVAAARQSVADMYNAADPAEIKFGYNMTTLTFHLSRSITACFEPGDEIVVTTLDHEANVSPWQLAARDRELVVRTVDIRPDDCTLDMDDLESKLTPRTRLVAVGYASNAVGTINPVAEVARRAHAVGAWVYVDAVHYAPHGVIDVQALGADFLVTSAYKWFGPHLGALYGRRDILEHLPPYKVRPAHDAFETGTPNFEAIAGAGAAVEYLASLGHGETLRTRLVDAMRAVRGHELELTARLVAGLHQIPGVRIWGISDPARFSAERAPTLAATLARTSATDAAAHLGGRGIFTWDGHFYAQALVERLGLADSGGLLRLGIVHYNTAAEVDRLLGELETIA